MTEENNQSEKERIMELLERNYTRSQMINDFRFAARTVDRAIKVYKELHPEGDEDERHEDETAEIVSSLPVTLKRTEAITPEGIIQQCLSDGSPDWQLRIEGMMLLRAAQRMNLDDMELAKGQAEVHARMMKPILDTMIEISREQDAAARRAMGANEEVAYRAATDVARQLAPEIQGLKSQIKAGFAPDPVTRMMNMMQSIPRMMQMGQQMMGMMGMPMLPQSPQGTLMGLQPPDQFGGQQPQTGHQPGGVNEASEDEVKEAFDD